MAVNTKPLPQMYYSLKNDTQYLTGVDKAHMASYADPLTLNFKLLVNFDKQVGLVADEKFPNSALAYLKRIGDEIRYEQLKQWIEVFKTVIKDYDFLMLDIEGLDNARIAKQYESINEEEDRINIIFRETSDMMIQSLVLTYREIWFDNVRRVEVLPSNLRKFDISILLFSGGFFKSFLYDEKLNAKGENNDIETLIYPTKKKLADYSFENKMSEKYSHVLFNFGSCSFFNEENGKSFYESISNEPGTEFTKNNLSISYKFANVRGRFNNLMGDYDLVAMLALLAAQNKMLNTQPKDSKDITFKDKLKGSFDSLKKSTMKTLETKKNQQLNKIRSGNSPIGEMISKFTVKNAEMMIKNTLDVGINYIEQKAINDPLAKLNNVLFQNFSNNLIDIYKNNFNENKNNNIELLNNEPNPAYSSTQYTPENVGNVQKGISFGTENIYTRTNF